MGSVLTSTPAVVTYTTATTTTTTTTTTSSSSSRASDSYSDSETVSQTHTIPTSTTKSDCETCFDSSNSKTMLVTTHTLQNINERKHFGGRGYITGPTVTRSGNMITELCLGCPNGEAGERVRVIFQHAPVWSEEVDGGGPPDGLKLFRTVVCLESSTPPPSAAAAETAQPPPPPPFKWHGKWAGRSWTYGETSGDQAWTVPLLDEADSWHGRVRGDVDNVWGLKVGQGRVVLQAPKVVVSGRVEVFRVAWLKGDEEMHRVEGGVVAMEKIEDLGLEGEGGGGGGVRLAPPRLVTFRSDELVKVGEVDLEEESLLLREGRGRGRRGEK
ncbi:hypothetical protein ScalyP_jg10867 [Parmales sp. scaly parma]|nr:hypothetical protein ScalyP_jg10867 [Parmales sp. scaly parma]